MRKIVFALPVFFFIMVAACNNEADTKTGNSQTGKADSLEKEVLAGHDVAMPKSMKIPALQKETKLLIDSISKLPAKAREAAAPYKAKLESLLRDLSYADMAMNKWMDEFKFDSAKDNIEERIKYLTEEKDKVEKVKEAVLGSLSEADSLLKAKF
ncbi:MAG: viral A-type inclusion protein [Bacteroidota bacterium]